MPSTGLEKTATGRWFSTCTWRIATDEFPSSSVTSIVTFFIPGSSHPTLGFWRIDSVSEKLEVRLIPEPSRLTPPSKYQEYSTIIPSESSKTVGIVSGVSV